jgi:diacylglycerol kinase
MKKFMNSVRCALYGVRYAFATEKNIRVLLLIFICEVIAALVLEVAKIEFLLILAMAAVLFSLELANTAIERLADKVSPQYDEQIGVVKDVMAGAVMVASVFAFVIGCMIFFEPVLELFQ